MQVPGPIENLIASKTWRNPGAASLRKFLGLEVGYPDLELFEGLHTMRSVWSQLDTAGYPDDPNFCMSRQPLPINDQRLEFEQALFVAGATLPGEDVFVALNLQDNNNTLLVFDWREPIPTRWVPQSNLPILVELLSQ
tara:strand:- start:1164 stop:1577 length:414 start_codon:yes stop_codon:yes gene_type:complete